MFLNRNRLASYHRFIDCARTFYDHTVHRHLFAGTHAQAVADATASSGTSSSEPFSTGFVARTLLPGRAICGWLRRLAARAEFEHLPEQDQGDDDARRFEIGGHVSRFIAKGR